MAKKAAQTTETPRARASWTVMVLMGADTLEDELPLARFAEDDLQEMESLNLNPSVLNIIVQLDQADGPNAFS